MSTQPIYYLSEVKGYPYTFNLGGGARKIHSPYSFDTVTANGCLGDATQAREIRDRR
jgi:hypothetical protein